MGLETGTFINSLVATNPTGGDQKSQGDDHLRLIKSTLLNTFPAVTGSVTPTHTELNFVDGVTSAIQTQIDSKGAIAGQTWTGTHAFPATTSIGNVSATEIAFVDGVTSSIQAQIDTKSPIASPTFTGTVTLPATTSIGTVSSTEIGYLDNVTSSIQTQLDSKSPIASPTFTGTPAAPTPANGTNTTQIATTAFVINTAMNAQLPSQTGNAGKYLLTNGTNASWAGVASGLYHQALSAGYTALITDDKDVFDCTNTFTLSFSAAATLGNGWSCYVRNSGAGVITLDPNGAETINGAATYSLGAGNIAFIQCDGATFRTVIVAPNQLVRMPIFSAEAATATAASALEDISPATYNTNLTGSVNDVVYGNSLFIACSRQTAQGNVSTSPDGQTWTLRAMPSSASWTVGTDGTSRFIASANAATTIAKSTNGTVWSAGTALPAAAHGSYYGVVFNGATCLIFGQTASTCFTSSDNATTWSAAQTLPANTTSQPFVIGGLFWYFASGTTAYTSATGATGSWTARTLPVTPNPGSITYQTNGKLQLFVSGGGVGSTVYETSNGINWTTAAITLVDSYPPFLMNGVYVNYSDVFGSCMTYSNSVWTRRTSNVGFVSGYRYAIGGVNLVISAGTSSVVTINTTSPTTATALFTR